MDLSDDGYRQILGIFGVDFLGWPGGFTRIVDRRERTAANGSAVMFSCVTEDAEALEGIVGLVSEGTIVVEVVNGKKHAATAVFAFRTDGPFVAIAS